MVPNRSEFLVNKGVLALCAGVLCLTVFALTTIEMETLDVALRGDGGVCVYGTGCDGTFPKITGWPGKEPREEKAP